MVTAKNGETAALSVVFCAATLPRICGGPEAVARTVVLLSITVAPSVSASAIVKVVVTV